MHDSLMKRPSVVLPMAMSLAAFLLVVGHFALFGITHETDEGTPAHLFQLLIAGQLPFMAYFAARWLPRAPQRGLRVLALQIAATLPAFAAVYWLT